MQMNHIDIKTVFKNNGIGGTIVKSLNKLFSIVFLSFFKLFPVHDNYIVLESEGDYTDNIRVFYEYLIENNYNKKYRLIWFVHNPKKYKKEENVKFISRYHKFINIRANYYIGISKYFIFSHPYWLENWRKEQIVIGTSHSVFQLKATGNIQKKVVDYMLACGKPGKEVRKKHYNIKDEQILILGMPRIDLLYRHKDCISYILPDYHGEKIILSMETFKQTSSWDDSDHVNSFALNIVHNKEDLEKIDDFLEESKVKLIIKIHHLQDTSFLNLTQLKNILYLTDDILSEYDIQINELLENADILLTDYSSVFYEFLLFNRPVGFLIGDINEYSRGFVSENPLAEMPGEKIKNIDELFMFIKNCLNSKDNYEKEREKIKKQVFEFLDDKNCERLLNWIEAHN